MILESLWETTGDGYVRLAATQSLDLLKEARPHCRAHLTKIPPLLVWIFGSRFSKYHVPYKGQKNPIRFFIPWLSARFYFCFFQQFCHRFFWYASVNSAIFAFWAASSIVGSAINTACMFSWTYACPCVFMISACSFAKEASFCFDPLKTSHESGNENVLVRLTYWPSLSAIPNNKRDRSLL